MGIFRNILRTGYYKSTSEICFRTYFCIIGPLDEQNKTDAEYNGKIKEIDYLSRNNLDIF